MLGRGRILEAHLDEKVTTAHAKRNNDLRAFRLVIDEMALAGDHRRDRQVEIVAFLAEKPFCTAGDDVCDFADKVDHCIVDVVELVAQHTPISATGSRAWGCQSRRLDRSFY